MVNQFREYKEPDESEEKRTSSHSASAATATTKDEEDVLLPLGETILSNNLGIPIIVVATKVSHHSKLSIIFKNVLTHFCYSTLRCGPEKKAMSPFAIHFSNQIIKFLLPRHCFIRLQAFCLQSRGAGIESTLEARDGETYVFSCLPELQASEGQLVFDLCA